MAIDVGYKLRYIGLIITDNQNGTAASILLVAILLPVFNWRKYSGQAESLLENSSKQNA